MNQPMPFDVSLLTPTQGAPAMSVVIATWRRPQMLQRCLDGLLAQTFDARRLELVVADDGPDDATRAVVDGFAAAAPGWRVRYVPVRETQGPAAARNRGWQAATGDIIAFTDDDTIPAPTWLAEGWRTMTTPEDAASAGGGTPPDAATGAVRMPLPTRPTDYERDASGLTRAEFVTANCFVRRAMLARIGGFDERFRLAWREDSDLQFRILDAGGRIVQAPRALMHHPVRPAPWGVSVSQQRKVFYDALLYKKHPQRYRTRIRPVPPWHYYAMGAAVVIAFAALAAHRPWVAGAAAMVWLALTVRFTAMRLHGTAHTVRHVLEMFWTSIAIPPLALYWRLRGAWHFRVWFL
ncbi:glycosyltransferase family 2 protein [Ralstonia sp. NFACC01]|jgi:glycosyltransferase involved in cell wall biosynthesis|uniref:glycosyltransferase family 2 protein n=1 Tax=Ralstonia sp. NFACC01 TaxID=1566294 RepID=UPI0008E6A8B7|nr:glycosyltransferase [Ralstonia sp. NFACC01]SFP11494.1 Glycosyltransferase, GT2 family [Ralstonia sp. NFACC01]